MALPVLNTREDLDAIAGTPEYGDFIAYLKGSLTRLVDTQTYPEGYGEPGYEGEPLAPAWSEVEDLSTVERFGFTKAEILAM